MTESTARAYISQDLTVEAILEMYKNNPVFNTCVNIIEGNNGEKKYRSLISFLCKTIQDKQNEIDAMKLFISTIK